MSRPISTLAALRLLLGLRMRRFANAALHGQQPARDGSIAAARRPLKRLAVAVALVALTTAPMALFIGRIAERQHARATVDEIVLAPPGHDHLETVRPTRVLELPEPPAPGSSMPPSALATQHLIVLLLLGFVAFTEMASTRTETSPPDLELFAALPLAPTTVYQLRVLDQALLSLFGALEVGPGLAAIAWVCGHRLAAVPLALALTPLLVLPFVQLRAVAEVELRARFAPHQVRNAKAVLLVVAFSAAMTALLALGLQSDAMGAVRRVRAAAAAWMWLPPGLAVRALAATDAASGAAHVALLVGEGLVTLLVGAYLIDRRVRRGFDHALEREAGRGASALPPPRAWRLLTPVQSKLFMRFARDWAFLVTTLVGPVCVAVFEVVPFWALARGAGVELTLPRVLAAGLGVGAWFLHAGLLHTLVAERDTLWLLHALPRRIERGIADVAAVWFVIAGLPVALSFAVAVRLFPPRPSVALAWAAVLLLAHALVVAVAACCTLLDGTEVPDMPQTRTTARYGVLFLNVVLPLCGAVFSGSRWFIGVVLFVDAMLLWALVDRARDRAPYLLDPAAEPPRGITLFDALVSVNVYFQVQTIVLAILHVNLGKPPEPSAFFASTIACLFTILFARAWLEVTSGADQPLWRGPWLARDVAMGATLALASAAIAVPGIAYACKVGWLAERPRIEAHGAALASLVALAVIIAPIVEEFLFRGLVFAGVRKMTGAPAAIVFSALLFACLHAPVSAPAALVVGLVTGAARERTGALACGVAMHAVYNAILLWAQM